VHTSITAPNGSPDAWDFGRYWTFLYFLTQGIRSYNILSVMEVKDGPTDGFHPKHSENPGDYQVFCYLLSEALH